MGRSVTQEQIVGKCLYIYRGKYETWGEYDYGHCFVGWFDGSCTTNIGDTGVAFPMRPGRKAERLEYIYASQHLLRFDLRKKIWAH